ncbi:MAG: hypothetical protein JWM21_2329 [Acidobacteria bacterium]|nr:hypothetical protein [Acidobacteriota bacterium]
MAIMKGRPDAGQGGKRGHSNMDHWVYNDEIKEAARKDRRLRAKQDVALGLIESAELDDDSQAQAPAVNDPE